MMTLIGLVPARGGSKGIPHKNLASCGGKPLLAWTAEAALASEALDRVILSTDDSAIAEAGRSFGLEVPFLRPAELARDDTPMLAVVSHALERLHGDPTEIEGVVLLQPTSPFRRAHHIREAIDLFRRRLAATLVSVVRVPHRFFPDSLMMTESGRLVPYAGVVGPTRRQDKAELFARNGPAILIVRPGTIEEGRLYGDPTIGYEMDDIASIDIDSPADLRLADHLLLSGW
jgi:CMP-N-acetylneuraminic acid synthetase